MSHKHKLAGKAQIVRLADRRATLSGQMTLLEDELRTKLFSGKRSIFADRRRHVYF